MYFTSLPSFFFNYLGAYFFLGLFFGFNADLLREIVRQITVFYLSLQLGFGLRFQIIRLFMKLNTYINILLTIDS